MHAHDDRDQFAPPRPPARLRAITLAVLVHAVLIGALTWGVNWKNTADQPAVEAELWAAIPQQAAPREVLPPPPPPPPGRLGLSRFHLRTKARMSKACNNSDTTTGPVILRFTVDYSDYFLLPTGLVINPTLGTPASFSAAISCTTTAIFGAINIITITNYISILASR